MDKGKENWLEEQIRLAKEEVAAWPKWMKDATHFTGTDTFYGRTYDSGDRHSG